VRDDTDDDEEVSERPERRPARRRDRDEDDADERAVRRGSRFQSDGDEDEDDRPRRRKSRKKKGNPALLWSLIGGGAALLIGGVILLIVLLGGGKNDGSGSDKKGPGKQHDAWTLDPALENRLGAEVAFQGYLIRPPQGYVMRQQAVMGNQLTIWNGQRRADGTAPTLIATIFPLTGQEANLGLEVLMDQVVMGLRATMAGLTTEPKENGKISGIAFVRTHIKGNTKALRPDGAVAPLNIRGITYVAKDGNRGISLTFIDAEPHVEKSLPLAESTIASFKKP
jgi:hypothetical protein